MGSDGTRAFVLGGLSKGAWADNISLIHVFDTSTFFRSLLLSGQFSLVENAEYIEYPEPQRNALLSILMRRSQNL